MSVRMPFSSLLLAAVCAFGNACHAEPAYTTKSVHLRAGPGRSYPVVAILSPGFRVEIEGCLRNYTWCDVVADGERGWVYAANLSHAYEGRDVPVLGYGQVIGIGIIGFVFFDYWHQHYIDRPWYRDRHRWVHPPPHGPRPPGPPHPPPRPPHPPPPPHPPHDGQRPPPPDHPPAPPHRRPPTPPGRPTGK